LPGIQVRGRIVALFPDQPNLLPGTEPFSKVSNKQEDIQAMIDRAYEREVGRLLVECKEP
jgi:hypothetical protein